MRLQKQVNRVVQNKEYAKYVIIVAPEDIQQLGWKEGQELEREVRDQNLIIKPAKKSRTSG